MIVKLTPEEQHSYCYATCIKSRAYTMSLKKGDVLTDVQEMEGSKLYKKDTQQNVRG